MSVPGFLPDWVPWWVQLVLLVGVVLVVGAFGAMPFSVFGLKARLEAIDERLDEMQSDLRALANRLPDPEMRNPAAWRRGATDDEDFPAPATRREPPAPPPPARGFERDRDRDPRPARSEPQLNWPGNRPRG